MKFVLVSMVLVRAMVFTQETIPVPFTSLKKEM
jgi:hypothetical protein